MRVGAIELRLLEHLTDKGPASIREMAETFGQESKIGLTTVQQMMERLRAKGLLKREKVEGIWLYSAVESREKVMQGVVKDFVDRMLGGSLEPFTLYLADRSNISKKDLEEFREIVNRLSQEAENDR